MKLNEYQKKAAKAAFYEKDDIQYCALGLSEEAGEAAGHIKKMLRDDGGKLTKSRKEAIAKELGDTLWYLSRMAGKLGFDLDEIAKMNLDKIKGRVKRKTQHGSGDNR